MRDVIGDTDSPTRGRARDSKPKRSPSLSRDMMGGGGTLYTRQGSGLGIGENALINWRARSRSRARNEASEARDESDGRGRTKGPIKSIGRSLSRSLSRVRGKKEDKDNSDKGEKTTKRWRLPPSNKTTRPMDYEESPSTKEPKQQVNAEDDEIARILAERKLIVDDDEAHRKESKDEDTIISGELNEAAVMKLDERNTKLHVDCLLHNSTKTILERLEIEPDLAKFNNNANETPLHYAAMDKKGANKDVLKALIQIFPEAVKQPNTQNSLPIHLACMIGAPSLYVVKTFLKMYPKGVMIQSEFPLLFDEDMEVTQLESDDESSEGSEFADYVPNNEFNAAKSIAGLFACAAPNQAAIEMKRARTKKKEEMAGGTKKINHNDNSPTVETGFSPLHLAIMNGASPSIIELLIKTNYRCIFLKTSQGRTALDCAQYIVRQHWLYGSDDEDKIQNTFGAVEILEEAMKGETK